jgi:hypothetical protein
MSPTRTRCSSVLVDRRLHIRKPTNINQLHIYSSSISAPAGRTQMIVAFAVFAFDREWAWNEYMMKYDMQYIKETETNDEKLWINNIL